MRIGKIRGNIRCRQKRHKFGSNHRQSSPPCAQNIAITVFLVNKKLDPKVSLLKIWAWHAVTLSEMPEASSDTAARPAGGLRRERIQQILHAAEQCFAEKGFEGATTSEIAALAQLPKANVHYYFGTKEKIYQAVLDNILELWLGEADHWIAAGRSPREALTGYIQAKLSSARAKPEASRIYANELLRGAPHIRPYLDSALRKRVASLSAVLEHWIATGKIRAISPAHLLFCLWAMTQTYADFASQIGAVLNKPELDSSVFIEANETITQLVLTSLIIDPPLKGHP
jgi:TetR/AcrR family transcriptional regulator